MNANVCLPVGLSVTGVHNVGPLELKLGMGPALDLGWVKTIVVRHNRLFFLGGGGNSMAVLGRRRPPRAKSHKIDPPVVCPGG